MAEIKKGILGGFSGTVGTVVGTNWRGKDIIRSRPNRTSRQATPRQMEQRVKFAAVVNFLYPVKPVLAKYFGNEAGSRSRVNLATSYHITEALQLVAGVPQFLFNKVLLTKGELAGFQNPSVTPGAGHTLEFSWQDNSTQGSAAATDAFAYAAYCVELKQFVLEETGNTRDEGNASAQLPAAMGGKKVHVYAYLRNAAETAACTSVYLGQVQLT